MHLRTFSAGTMAEALYQVKSAMGNDAVILHTRTYWRRRWLGLRRYEVVEITAGAGLQTARKDPRRTLTRQPAPLAPSSPKPSANAPQQLLQTPAASNAVILGLSQDLGALKNMVLDLVKQSRAQNNPQVPEELFDHYMNLIQNQVANELAEEVIKNIQTTLRPEHKKNPEFIREKLAEQLERMMPVAGPIVRTKATGPHVVALIGPTGVGKTTTVAKLAANLKLREKHRVGLITLDTFRIAAVDQLKRYADIIGSPLRVVQTGEELLEAVKSMSDCDFLLIDTAGRSPNDTMKLNELRGLLSTVEPDEVHLVLSTTASEACINLAVSRFSEVRVDKIIFTKLDEAAHVGVVLNVVRRVNKSLSYITTGQDVPDDIEVGRGRRLAEIILGTRELTSA